MKPQREQTEQIFETIILLGVITLLQWHGIVFWYRHTHSISGILFSIILEIGTMWLWYRRESALKTAMAILCSLIIIAGPLYQIASPALQHYTSAKINTTLQDMLAQSYQQELAADSLALRKHLSKGTVARREAAEAARADLKATQRQYRGALKQQAQAAQDNATGWLDITQVIIQALGLLFLQWTQIAVIREWGRRRLNILRELTELAELRATQRRNAVEHPEPVRQPQPAKQPEPAHPLAVEVPRTASPVEKAKLVAQAVAGGAFNDGPVVNRIKQTMGVRHSHIIAAFKWLQSQGMMTVDNNKARLLKQRNLTLDEINIDGIAA